MSTLPALLGGDPVFDVFVPIVRPVLPSFDELKNDISEILGSGMLTKGKHLVAFEEAVAAHLGVKHAIAVSSCTSGLMLVHAGLKLTGEVIVPSFTFMATVSAAVWAGLNPILVDVDRATTNLDPTLIEAAITPNTSAILAVHNFGNPSYIEELQAVANQYGLKLVFDAAHGFGACYRGQPVGGFGVAEVFSLSPTKLVIAGEGGIVATNHDTLARQIRIGREYGMSHSYDSAFPGFNARMPEMSALVGLHSLARLEDGARRRNEIADFYRQELANMPGIAFQGVHTGDQCSYKDFSIVIDEQVFGLSRDILAIALKAENIDSRKYYDPPVHRQTAYRNLKRPASGLPVTEFLANNSLSLPIWSRMEQPFCVGIVQAIKRIHKYAIAVTEAVHGLPN